jgi:hypothetical protein
MMGDDKKLSVEKALNKIRKDEAQQTLSEKREQEMDKLDEDIARMRAQRQRLERRPRKGD